jgi:hypothetical protein
LGSAFVIVHHCRAIQSAKVGAQLIESAENIRSSGEGSPPPVDELEVADDGNLDELPG